MNSNNLPDFIITSKFMCTECLAQPIYFDDKFCSYPRCNEPGCLKKDCNDRNSFKDKCDYFKCTSPQLLRNFIERPCRQALHNLDRTKEIGIFMLKKLNSKFNGKNIFLEDDNLVSIDDGFMSEIKTGFFEIANKYSKLRVLNDEDFDILLKHYCYQYNIHINNRQQIDKIIVKNLFGYYSYDLEMNEPDKISIILGTNGLGKTTIFRLLETLLIYKESNFFNKKIDKEMDIFKKEYSDNENSIENIFSDRYSYEKQSENTIIDRVNYLLDLPFSSFEIKFCDGSYIKTLKDGESREVIITYSKYGFDEASDVIFMQHNDEKNIKEYNRHINNIKKFFPLINNENKFLFIKTNRFNNLSNIKYNTYSLVENIIKYVNNVDDTNIFLDNFNKYFSLITNFDFVDSLIEKIESLRDYFINFEKNNIFGSIVYVSEKKQKDYLEKQIDKINEYFLLEPISLDICVDANCPLNCSILSSKINEALKIIENIKTINYYFSQFFTENSVGRKSIIFDKHNLLLIKNSINEVLPIDCLSSGEINLLSIIYNLIFKADSGSIILIDEPEVSLHIAWQTQLLDTIMDLIAERNIQVIIASHSPFISAGRSDLLIKRKTINEDDK